MSFDSKIYGKYKLAVGIGMPNYIPYSNRYIRFSEVLGKQRIELTEQYTSLAVF